MSSCSVSASVLAPGCFWIAMMTPLCVTGSHSSFREEAEPVPRRMLDPTWTIPRSETITDRSNRELITVVPISSTSLRRPMPRRMYSPPASIRNPADTFSLACCSASATSSMLTSKALRRFGSSTTWNCFSSPPMGVTWDTPGSASNRLRIRDLAVVRRVRPSCRSDVNEMKRISPTPSGRSPATPASRSVTVNCAAFSESLLESELFGYVRGAFTGAEGSRQGKFATADGGTLFLDEIGNMPLGFQQKILRVVEYGTYLPVGGDVEHKTNARILAATNVDLKERITTGDFLSDLYDRLAFEVIEVPRLRERPEDIPSLAVTFLESFAREVPASKGRELDAAALARLAEYSFPGNIRELKNIIERAAYRSEGPIIRAGDIGPLERERPPSAEGFKGRVDSYAQGLLMDAMQEASGVQSRAARALGLSYHQFRYYWRKYQSQPESGAIGKGTPN